MDVVLDGEDDMSWKDHTMLSALKFIVLTQGGHQDMEIKGKLLKRLDDEIAAINNTLNMGFGEQGVIVGEDPIWGAKS